MACPQPAIWLTLADRFHKWPWQLEDEPADRVLFWLNVMSVEAEARNDREGLAPDEPSVRMD